MGKWGTASSTFISKRCSRTPASCKKSSLLQMTSPVSGRKTMMGRGELMRVDLLAVSTLPVMLSIYCRIFFCRARLLRTNQA